MADIDIQRKKHHYAWLWLLALLALALLAWYFLADGDREDVATPAPAAVPVDAVAGPAQPAPGTPAPAAGIPIAAILGSPAEWSGRTVSGQVRVAEAVSDRGFWIEDGGQRLFVVKNESPRPGVADVQGAADTMSSRNLNAGQMVQMSGTVHTSADQVAPPIDERTKSILANQRVFMTTNVADIQHMAGS